MTLNYKQTLELERRLENDQNEKPKAATTGPVSSEQVLPAQEPPIAEGPGILDYGSDAAGELLERMERLASSGEYVFIVGDGLFLNEAFPALAKKVKTHKDVNFTLKSKSSAYDLSRILNGAGIAHVVLTWDAAKDEYAVQLLGLVPGLTVHTLSNDKKGITKRNIASNGEELPSGVNLLADSLYLDGGIPEIPSEALYGKAADMARLLETPLGFAYPAVLAAACGTGIEARGSIRPTLYVSLLGPIHSGKSVTQQRAIELFLPNISKVTQRAAELYPTAGFDGDKIPAPQPTDQEETTDPRNLQDTAASDQGLYRILTEAKGQSRLMSQDEGRNLLTKASIEGSSLAPVLCQLFNMNYAGGADKKSRYSINVKLSMLLCVKIDNPAEFPVVFGFSSAHGLYDRNLYGVHPADDFKFKPWQRPDFRLSTTTPSVSPDVFDRVNGWGDKKDRRLGELALRVAYVTCAINGDDHVTDDSLTAALSLMEWQKRLRIFYQTAKGANEHQDCVETILEAFRRAPGKCGNWRDMTQRGNWHRKFPRVFSSMKKMLESQGILCFDTTTKKHFLNEGQ